ncbi:DNA helicase [Staphylococcus phage phiIBB-SEP1]|uniref:DNA helicase n=1 Tax=Staphylococcus phage phiIBB-SEP1 TaxID=1340769 RepID=W5R8R6_9CAUD|nr:DNA helicase [Staphylococcus phage phiIBB-SEP1]AGR48173.1 DNA helicase [Staphylococcus phage phiIBB-SEP1]
MKLHVKNLYTYIEFEEGDSYLKDIILKRMHTTLGARQEGFQYSPAYKRGQWDGYIDFYEYDRDRFPTGLLFKVQELLGELQSRYNFQYGITDERDESFLAEEDIDKEINLLDDNVGQITLRDYQYDAVFNSLTYFNGILHISTNGGKTEIASGIIDQLLPQLERGERIAFFTGSTEIFHQSADRLKQRLNIPIGKVGAGQFNIQQVTVVMVPTLNANLKDPTQGVKLTPKQNISKKIATEFLPKFEGGTNQKKLLGMLLDNFIPKTKVEQTVKDELIGIYKSCKNDNEVLMRLKNHNANFQNIVRNKNKKKYDKYHRMREFLDTITVMIVDEAHHSKSDTWYNNLMTCENALYRIALTGSIDKKDELLWMRMQGLFGDVISRVTNKQLIEEGHSAKPTINIIPIANPNDIDNIDEYRVAYEKGIINNNFRNKLIAKLTEKWYNEDKGILIIVNFIDHGNNISELLDGLNVEHYFLHGEVDSEIRKQKLNDMRSGKLKVMIATSLIDEGVDISGINSLILGAGGKSLRQVLQRVGRALRKKKDDNTTQIYDFADMTNRFLFHHSKEREKIYREEEFEIRKM